MHARRSCDERGRRPGITSRGMAPVTPAACCFCGSPRLDPRGDEVFRCDDCGSTWSDAAEGVTGQGPGRFLYASALAALLHPCRGGDLLPLEDAGEPAADGIAFLADAPGLLRDPPSVFRGRLERLPARGVLIFEFPAPSPQAGAGWRATRPALAALFERLGWRCVTRALQGRDGPFTLGLAARPPVLTEAYDTLLSALVDDGSANHAAALARAMLQAGRLGTPPDPGAAIPPALAASFLPDAMSHWRSDRAALQAERARAAALEAELDETRTALRRAEARLGTERSDHATTRRRLVAAIANMPDDELPARGREREHGAPLVSVVIPCFNYGETVGDAVASVLAQTFQDLEVIVVEGGSTDAATRRTVANLSGPRLRILMQGRAHRAGANRNLGIAAARGRYVLCLDADDLLRPTYVEKAVFLLEHCGYDVVSSGMEMFGAETGRLDTLRRPDLARLLEGNHVLTCAVFRRRLWHESGGYRDGGEGVRGHVHEDWAFWVRLAALGARFYNMGDDHLLLYRVHARSLSRRKDVLPLERQRELVRALNADVLTPEAIEQSAWRRELSYCPDAPRQPRPVPKAGPARRSLVLALPWMVLGGAERLLAGLVRYLVAEGWRVSIVTSLPPAPGAGDTTGWFERHAPDIFQLPRFLEQEDWPGFLQHLIASRRADSLLLVGSAFVYGQLASLRAWMPELRVVDLLFNTVGHVANNRRRRGEIDLTIVENREVEDWLLARGEARERVRLIPSAVDLSAAHPGLRTGALRARVGATGGELLIGFCGRWSEEKNPSAFLQLAARAPASWPLRFVMTGTGPQKAALEREIRAMRIPNGRLHVLGVVDDVLPVLADLDLLVLPSLLDGRPVVVLEALAVGTPVLASHVGGLPDLIQEGETGWLCPPGDLDALLRRLAEVASGAADLHGMRGRARAYAEAELDRDRMMRSFAEALSVPVPRSNPA